MSVSHLSKLSVCFSFCLSVWKLISVPIWNCRLSISRIEAGAQRCLATSLTKATPCSKLGSTTEPYRRTSGMGLIRIVTSVITPKLPVCGLYSEIVITQVCDTACLQSRHAWSDVYLDLEGPWTLRGSEKHHWHMTLRQTDRQLDISLTDTLTDRQTDWGTHRQTDWLADWHTDRHTDRLTNKQTDWQTERKTDRQTDGRTDTY